MLTDHLKSLSNFSTVLEIGCGFGRITRLLLSNFPEIKEYLAVDLSPDQIENAKQYLKSAIIHKNVDLRFIVSDIQSLQLDKKYDLVISSELLLHLPPIEIVEVMTKLAGLSNKHVINIDYFHETPTKLAPHNFLHQYEKIYNEIPSIRQVRRVPIENKKGLFKKDTKQSIFHALVSDN